MSGINDMNKLSGADGVGGAGKLSYRGPVVVVVMDGVGLNESSVGNAVKLARADTLNKLMAERPWVSLRASGEAVGLPDGQMGNSEVGHYVMGSGVISRQALQMVDDDFASGRIFEGETWRKLVGNVNDNDSCLHFIGILSDGRVHGDMAHMKKMVARADEEGVGKIRVHVLIDGRDVAARSEPKYIDEAEEFLAGFVARGRDYRIASGTGREVATMNRYWSDVEMMKRGLDVHVRGIGRGFSSAREAVLAMQAEDSSVDDQWLQPFVIVDENGEAIGRMADGDSVVMWNFRADRAIQFSEMMTAVEFPYFERGEMPDVVYAGMVEYDQERGIPENTLVAPVSVDGVLAELEVAHGRRRLVVSESIKFGHVTFYFNGNKTGKFSEELEEYVDLPNKLGEPWKFPWMRSDEIADVVVERVSSGSCDSVLVNFPNGDIVGHEADLRASVVAVEAVDIALGRILRAVDEAGGVALITADHGNCEETFYVDEAGEISVDEAGEAVRKTSHTTNRVPFIVYDNTENSGKWRLREGDFGLSNVAGTVAVFSGLTPLGKWDEGLVEVIE